MQKIFRKIVSIVVSVLPAGSPERIYGMLFRGVLGKLASPLIRALLPKQVRIPEGIVVMNPTDPAVSGAIAFNVFEPYESELFRSRIKENMTVVDIGANIGYYTVIAAQRVGKNGKVIAFEPAPENFEVLKKTIAANNFTQVMPHKIAVADKKGEMVMNLFETNKGRHSLVKDGSDEGGFNATIPVMTVALDNFLLENGVDHVDAIKMDIEGAESIALLGMSETLKQVQSMFVEFTPFAIKKIGHEPKEMLSAIRNAGFSIAVIEERKKVLQDISDDEKLIALIPSGECVNLFCERK